jgi:hypothetical protein
LALLAGALFALNRYGQWMDAYEKGILLLAAPVFAWLGWHWKPVRWLMALPGRAGAVGGMRCMTARWRRPIQRSSSNTCCPASRPFCG